MSKSSLKNKKAKSNSYIDRPLGNLAGLQTKKAHIVMLIVVLLLPFIGWGVGAVQNPSGWMSDPSIVIMLPILLLQVAWPLAFIALPLFFIYFTSANKIMAKTAALIALMLLSITYSIFLLFSVAEANESEFTG